MNQGKLYTDMKWQASHFRRSGEEGWIPIVDFKPESDNPTEFLLNDGTVKFVRNQTEYPPRNQNNE